MQAIPDPAAFARELAAANRRRAGSLIGSVPHEALASLLLIPAWPVSLATKGFPGAGGTVLSGQAVREQLASIEKSGLARSFDGEIPWNEPWYSMDRQQRALVLTELTRAHAHEPGYFERQIQGNVLRLAEAASGASLPLPLERWIDIARASSHPAMASILDARVEKAIEGSRKRGEVSCPEALRWIETAQPFAELFGGVVEAALARARRKLELFHRMQRDERLLDNYLARPELEANFSRLMSDASAEWAIHFIGLGGVGKTMLMRSIRTRLARKLGLVTARVDFDNFDPDYPRRYPGLLLMAFAEELRLTDDEAVVDSFRKFDDQVAVAHEKIEGINRVAGSAAAADVDSALTRAEGAFVEALTILAETKRPVLILDTCEELAKLRTAENLPQSLLRTFEVIEGLHRAVPNLRVVFSGRRLLTARAANWSGRGSSAPPREYLRIVEITPFTAPEARRFLDQYRQGKSGIPSDLWEAILQQTGRPYRLLLESREGDQGEVPVYHGPFDLDLYARWAASDTALTRDRISQGPHVYVRERIVGRIHDDYRTLLPTLVALKRFDRDMIAALSGKGGSDLDGLCDEIVNDENVEVDPDARQDGETWGFEPNLRQRLEYYFREQEPSSWSSALERVRPLLESVTIERPWSGLTPAYFSAAAEVLGNDPVRGATWWSRVEGKVSRDRKWDWAESITDLLLDPEGPMGEVVTTERPGHPLRAAVVATRAAAMLRSNVDVLEQAWSDVLACLERHPIPARRAVLEHRARVGLVAALRYGVHDESSSPSANFEDRLRQVPDPPFGTGTPDLQVVATEIALLDHCVEIAEFAATTGLRTSLEDVRTRVARLPELPGVWRAFVRILEARMDALDGIEPMVHGTDGDMWDDPDDAPLDWRRPVDLGARIRLERARLERWKVFPDLELFETQFDTQDMDRIVSLGYLGGLDYGKALIPNDEEIERSVKVSRTPPECQAHRDVPRFFVTAIEILAFEGNVRKAMQWAERIAANPELPLDVRQAADRIWLRVAWGARSFDTLPMRRTSLEGSSNLRDLALVCAAVAFQPRSKANYPGRWAEAALMRVPHLEAGSNLSSNFEHMSIELDLIESGAETKPAWWDRLPEWRRARPLSVEDGFTLESRRFVHDPPDAWPRADEPLAPYRCGVILMEEGNVLALRRPSEALWLLDRAVDVFLRMGDARNLGIAATSLGLAAARAGRRRELDRACASFFEEPPTIELLDREADSVELPWRIRQLACLVRKAEFFKSGRRTQQLQKWLKAHGREDLPDLAGVLLPSAVETAVNSLDRSLLGRVARIVGASFAVLSLLVGFFLATDWLRNRLEISWWVVIGAMGAIWGVVRLLPRLSRAAMSLAFSPFLTRFSFVPAESIADPNDPLASPTVLGVGVSVLNRVPMNRTITRRVESVEAKSYDAIARAFFSDFPENGGWAIRLYWKFVSQARIRTELAVHQACAAVCWEAVLGLAGKRIAMGYPFVFRRVSAAQTEFKKQDPFAGPMLVRTWANDASLERALGGVLSASPRRDLRFETGSAKFRQFDEWMDEYDTGVLHLFAEGRESSVGLRLGLSKVGDDILVEKVCETFPTLRLCILQCFPSAIRRRLESDRISAGLVRRAAARLFESGVPMVVVIPPVPMDQARRALEILGHAIRRSVNANGMADAVQRIRNTIANAENVDHEAASEIALDVCLYAAPNAHLRVRYYPNRRRP